MKAARRTPRRRPDDVVTDTIAAPQKCVVTRAQLLQAGMTSHAIDHAVRRGRLIPLYRGVYQVGPVLAPWGRELAAVLACGHGAVLSHRSAAVLWGMLPTEPDGPVDVTVPGPRRVRLAGVRLHRVDVPLATTERGKREGLPVTSPARTLIDLAATASAGDLRRALDNAEQARIIVVRSLLRWIGRYAGRRGVARLKALLPATGSRHLTRSQFERTFLRLLRKYGLPLPRTNVTVLGYVVDCYWEELGLIVELDGYHVHGTRRAFDADRRRDLALAAAGKRVLRISWTQLETRPEMTMAQVAQALVMR
ncbi:MAG TPA: DUF559 domain-containing protein [Longimicrobiales bacterium]|nr:DUF559 domain-containing protein [Longimicrobiales bacterium]